MIEVIDIEDFLHYKKLLPVLDVRSPIEFAKGHVPGSLNIPLFSDDQRAHIGTVYKNIGSEKAVKLGESYANPQIMQYLEESLKAAPEKKLIVYCFRGGMRSQRFSALLNENGFSVLRLESGYKSYRQHILQSFTIHFPLQILGGKTGSGKTEILNEMKKAKAQVIDLEKLANHRGSAFGGFDGGYQPTSEYFENCLAEELSLLSMRNTIWIEDESKSIGRVYIPDAFYKQMKTAPLVVIILPGESRVERLCREYANAGHEPLISGIGKISRRLGGERAAMAISAVERDDYAEAATIILEYYDKCYDYGLSNKENSSIEMLKVVKDDPSSIAGELMAIDNSIQRDVPRW